MKRLFIVFVFSIITILGVIAQQYTPEEVQKLKQLANSGYADAQDVLGLCYYEGIGIAQSYTEAAKWWRKAADQGYDGAQHNLGLCYYNGQGVTQSYTEALKWFRKAADQGYEDSQFYIGILYEQGHGVVKSYAESAKWFRLAAEKGLMQAQFNLGNYYYKGLGVTKSFTEAAKWYRKAADKGLDKAQFMLGLCYYNGEGVTKSLTEATTWWRKAADQGNEMAKQRLKQMTDDDKTNSGNTSVSSSSVSEGVVFKKIWLEHNVQRNGQMCLLIHVSIEVSGMKGKRCSAIAYIDSPKGVGVKDTNGQYCTQGGTVSTHMEFTPSYDTSVYKDFTLVIPNTELHLMPGTRSYYTRVFIEGPNGFIGHSEFASFSATVN